MSTYLDNRYGTSLPYSQKVEIGSKYGIPSLSKESSYGYKPDSQSYTSSTANYAAKGMGSSGVYKGTTSKAQDPLSYMPPINANYKRTESNFTNYTNMSTLKPSDSILTREVVKRTMAPSPQAQTSKVAGPVGVTYGKDYSMKEYSAAITGHVMSAAAYATDKNMSQSQAYRPGVPAATNFTRDYPIKDYQGALGGHITGAASYSQDKSTTSAERRFLGISGQLKPQSISSGSRKNQYAYQDNPNEEMSSPVKPTKDILTRSNSKYGDQSTYSGYGDIAAEREGSGRLGTGNMLNDRSIGGMSRQGENEKIGSDAYSRKPLTNMQSNNYMNSSTNPTNVGMKTSENDTYGRSNLLKNETASIGKGSAGSWTPSEPKGLVGLRNIGNTCFMNSILQSLFNTPELSDFLASGKFMNQINHKREKGIARAFADILSKIRNHVGSPSYSAESTYMLKRRIEESNSMFSGYDQHDAQEFLKALLEGIHEDLNRVHEKPPYKELKADVNRPLQTISSEWYDYMLGRDNSIITDLFSGQLLSRTTCTHCGYESLAFDNFWDLSLSFTRGLSMLDSSNLLRMMEHFLKEELLDDLFNCERCKQKRKFKKCFVIWRLPKVLVIHLKRFHYGKYKKEKITQNVRFPVHDLDLTDFVKESKDPSVRDAHYSLFGIVNHSGSLNGGHYTAECVNPFNRKWYNFNDSSVRESHALGPRDQEAEGESPYILFYVKK